MDRISRAELDELELSDAGNDTIAATALRWVDDPGVEFVQPVTEAAVLILAAERLELAGDLDGALAAALRAQRLEPGEAGPALVSIRLGRGERTHALELADELRKTAFTVEIAERLAEAFELAGELELAERWFVLATRALPGGTDDDHRASLLTGRYRVRRDAGKTLDVLDVETEQLAAALGRRLG